MKKKYYKLFILFLIILIPDLHGQWLYQQVPADVGILLSIDFVNNNSGVSTGWILNNEATGRAIYTSNGGSNWMLASIPDSSRALVTVQMINSYTGYCAGAYDIIRPNIFPHINYKIKFSPGKPVKFNLTGISDSIAGTRAYFLKTTNSGHSWFPYGNFPVNLYYLIGMYFTNESTGFVSAERFYNTIDAHGIYKTTNGGLNWSFSYSAADTVDIRNIHFVDNNTGFGVGYDIVQSSVNVIQGLILKTTNSGNNWSKQLFFDVNNFTDVSFANNQTGFACGVDNSNDIYRGIIYKTTNSGVNWVKLSYQSDTTIFDGIQFYPLTGTGIVYGIESREDSLYPGVYWFEHLVIAKTTNYGSSWQPYQIDNTDYIYVGNKMIDINNWYICGGDVFSSAKILHTTNGGIGIKPISTEVPNQFKLFQNYPNPFNPTTKIRFAIPSNVKREMSNVKIIVYDILGHEVETLVNEQLQPGTYEADWNAANFSSGVYYYKLQTDAFYEPSGSKNRGSTSFSTSYTETKKMILIK